MEKITSTLTSSETMPRVTSTLTSSFKQPISVHRWSESESRAGRCRTGTRSARRRWWGRGRRNNGFHLDDCIEFRKVKEESSQTGRTTGGILFHSQWTIQPHSSLAQKREDDWSDQEIVPTIVDDQQRYHTNEDKANARAKCLARNSSNANFPPKFEEKKSRWDQETE